MQTEEELNENWTLNYAEPSECIMDNSGIYTVINRQEKTETHKQYAGMRVSVRIDVMADADVPLISFQGAAEDVRKAVIRWIENHFGFIHGRSFSIEHASYIGAELERAMSDTKYVQR